MSEAKLKELEAPKHARDMAGVMVGRKRLLHALGAATPEDVAKAEAEHEAAKQAHAKAAIDPHEIDVAAQAVIDARTPVGE